MLACCRTAQTKRTEDEMEISFQIQHKTSIFEGEEKIERTKEKKKIWFMLKVLLADYWYHKKKISQMIALKINIDIE